MTENELYEKYVDPIYLPLIGTVILNEPKEERNKFITKFKSIVTKADDQIIKLLLSNSNWRFSLVGAWVCFARNKIEFTDEIGKMLLRGKSGTFGYCYALAKFGSVDAAQYLSKYLEKELKKTDEAFQDTALYALKYIDRSNGSDFTKLILTPNGLWDNFVIKFKLSQYDRWNNFDRHFDTFVDMFDFIEIGTQGNGH